MRAGIGLVGRDDEIAALERFLTGLGPAAMVVRGDAGVGKSALTSEVTARADGWRVVRAVGVESETAFSLGGLNQLVYALRDVALTEADRDVLAPVLGADPVAAPQPMPLAMAVLNLLTAAAEAQPLLLMVDDVHWFDELSATVLSVVGRRLTHPRVRILVTYRPHAGSDFLAAGWSELTLGPLGPVESAQVVDRLAAPLSAAAKRAILAAADGNPLALAELPRYADQIDGWSAAVPLTDRLVTVFGGRFEQLDERVRTELLRAALDGSGTSARYLMRDVQYAVDLNLLIVDSLGDNVFRHPLVRAAVIHKSSADERRAAHAHLATLYDDVLVRRATHLGAAVVEPDQQVADLLAEAAQLTIRRGGAATAVDWLQRAARLSTVAARRTELLAEAAFVAAQAGRYDAAESLSDTEESGAAVLTGAYLALYRDGELIATHRRVLAALRRADDSVDDATVARLLKLVLAISQYAADADLWEQAEAVVDALGHRVDELSLLYRDAWGDTTRHGGTVRERLTQQLERLGALEPWEVMRLAVAAYYVDGLADFRDTLRRLFDREHNRGAVTNAITMQQLLLLDLIASGEWVAAAEAGRIGLELTTTHRNDLFGHQFTAYLGVLAASRGDVEEARRCAADVLGWAGPRRAGLLLACVQRIAVLTALADGDYETAYGAACRITAPGEFPPYSHASIDTVLDFVESAVHAGHLDEARTHAQAARQIGLGAVSPRLDAIVLAVEAMTGPDAEADTGYRGALAHAGLAGFPFERARIQLAHGMWLRRQRRHTDAREALQLAVNVFDTLGADPWTERARTELRAAGATLKRADGAELTAQERRIAELAAAGHSNKQIAAQLYLSPRTVGAHLYRIFPKLGVTSRAGLGAALREQE